MDGEEEKKSNQLEIGAFNLDGITSGCEVVRGYLTHHHPGTFTPVSSIRSILLSRTTQVIKETLPSLYFLTWGYIICITQWSGFQWLHRAEPTQREGWQTRPLTHRWDTEGAKSSWQLCCLRQCDVCPRLDVTAASARQLGKKRDRSECFQNWCNLLFWHPKSTVH